MAFELTPIDAPVTQGLPGSWLEFRENGVAVGDSNIEVLDIVGDPSILMATRGVGENSHIVTIRATAVPAIGWLNSIVSSAGTASHSNSGTGFFDHVNPNLNMATLVYAGMVGFAGETLVWSSIWDPTAADPSPVVTDIGGGKVSVQWKPSGSTRNGLLTLTASIDGTPVAVGKRLVFTCDPALDPGFGFYNPVAWGPEP